MNAVVHISTTITDLVTGFLLPLLIAVITKSSATTFEKRLVLGICSAVAAVVSTLATTNNAVYGVTSWISLALVFIMSIASYYGWWKGGTSFTMLQTKTSTVGIGSGGKHAAKDAGEVLLKDALEFVILVVGVLALVTWLYNTWSS